MLKAGQVGVRYKETSLDISKELGFLADVPGGVYFLLSGLSGHTGNLEVCVWVVMVFKS